MKNLKKQIFTIFLVVISYSYYEVVYKPFPFISMDYTNSIEKINEFSFDDYVNYNYKNINKKETTSMSEFQKIVWAVEQTRYLQSNSRGVLLRGEEDIFDDDIDYQNICSENSKILSSFLSELGFPNRIIWMNGHTVNEVFYKNKWVLIDSYGNVLSKDKKGNLLSLYEVLNDFENINFYKISDNFYNNLPDYIDDNYLTKPKNVYSQQDLFVVLDNDTVFNLHIKNRDFISIASSFFSDYEKGVGRGIQFVFKDDTKLVGNYGVAFYKKIKFFFKEMQFK